MQSSQYIRGECLNLRAEPPRVKPGLGTCRDCVKECKFVYISATSTKMLKELCHGVFIHFSDLTKLFSH